MAVILPLLLAQIIAAQDTIATPSAPDVSETIAGANTPGATIPGATITGTEPIQQCDSQDSCVITYPAAFFDRYNPITALDMVVNVPGFQIDDGDGSRGFAGAAGNILINSERPATKSESASDILSRIPSSSIERIDLIRGQTGGLDLRGQSVAVNVIIRADAGSTITWSVEQNARLDDVGFFPIGEISYTDSSGPLTYTAGIESGRFRFRSEGIEQLLSPTSELLEIRDEFFVEDGFFTNFTFNSQLKSGQTTYRLNGSLNYSQSDGGETSERFPVSGEPATFFLQGAGPDSGISVEIGAEIERSFGDALSAKIIGLFQRDDNSNGGSLAIGGPTINDAFLGTITQSETLNTESIIRTEIDYSGIKGHLLEFSAEGALNRLESAFTLLIDNDGGAGPTPLDVAGGVTEVRELRGDFSLSDSFKLGPIAIDAILAAEISNIAQTGGFEENRTFFFFKPSLTGTWSPSQSTQVRARALREIGQLNFFDFVSSTDLGDGELALGNPDLAPETTWTFDLSVEKRFGEIGALTITGFYNFISDVDDILPIGDGLEVPGNIGSGFRRGISGEATLPFDWTGVKNARLDITARYQDSEVTDPVTGALRILSNERPWRVDYEFRHDIVSQKWAWGFDGSFRDDETSFGLDELDIAIRPPDLDAFIETTKVQGIKIRLEMGNVLGEGFDRNRTVFVGARDQSPIAFQELRERNIGRRLSFTVSGTF